MIKEYSWTINGIYKENAEDVALELEEIQKTQELIPENVLEYARTHKASTLYRMFEWDDTVAAERYRRYQASQIIVHIKVEIKKDENQTVKKPVRAFVQIKRKQEYIPIETIVKDTDRYQILLDKAYKELNGIKNKYTELIEIQELLKDIPEE